MATTSRTPRQKQGDDLVPITVLVKPATRERLKARAGALKRPVSWLARELLESAIAALDSDASPVKTGATPPVPWTPAG